MKKRSGRNSTLLPKGRSREPSSASDLLVIEYEKAKKYFRRHQKNLFDMHEAEDFAGWVVEKRLKGRKANLRQLLTDYLRANIIDQRIHKNVYPRYTYEIREDDAITDPLLDIIDSIDVGLLMKILTEFEHKLITLYYFKGMTYEKIAEELDVAEHSIAQMMRAIIERIRNYVGYY